MRLLGASAGDGLTHITPCTIRTAGFAPRRVNETFTYRLMLSAPAPPSRLCRGSGFPAPAAAGPVRGLGGAAAAVPAPGPGGCGRADGAAGSPLPPCMGGGRLPPRLASPAPPSLFGFDRDLVLHDTSSAT
ncbi:translation initiation factor IF-2-like [Dryobates pubescens]|uniref:translation initiation factor IF-2-like n=1 Tax=Dryobates pubescens TaxID=118200 RepID=UPI0023B89379|nr:translation initiation factor IF-2-like [Dryobates pubescens]